MEEESIKELTDKVLQYFKNKYKGCKREALLMALVDKQIYINTLKQNRDEAIKELHETIKLLSDEEWRKSTLKDIHYRTVRDRLLKPIIDILNKN